MNRTPFVVLAAVLLIAAAGCEEDDERLARFAEESVRQQAGQNRQTAQLNREVVRAQQELVALQHDLGEQQAEVNHQRDRLESERRELATQRRRDPIIAAAIRGVGLALACLAPLTLAGYLLYCLRTQEEDPAITEMLIEEMVSQQPVLLAPPRMDVAAIADQRQPDPPSLTQADAKQDGDPVD